MRAREGMALMEVLVAGVLSTLVLGSAAALLQAQAKLAYDVSARSERNDAMRSAVLTLRAELRAIAPATDLRAVGRDSIASRVFRGSAVICGFRSGVTYARYRGLRLPDPAKDSVVQVGAENTSVLLTVSQSLGSCPHATGEDVLTFNVAAAAPVGSMWLVFENGAYHVSTQAVRYRQGADSRQPITNEVINDRASWFAITGDTLARGLRIYLRHRGSVAAVMDNFALLNGP
jgi:hypothetical protein